MPRPDRFPVKFVPQPSITAYELALLLSRSFPVVVDTLTGLGATSPDGTCTEAEWKDIPDHIRRHIVRLG